MHRKDRQAASALYSVTPMDILQHLITKATAKVSWEAVKAMYQEHARVQGKMQSYECTMESHGMILMNDEVEPGL